MPNHNAIAIANIFVKLAQDRKHYLSKLPLMKFIYFAHGWTLGYTGQPLIKEDILVWKFGPAIIEVYRAFAKKGFYIQTPALDKRGKEITCEQDLSTKERDLIHNVFDDYSTVDAMELVGITHAKGAPWSISKQRGESVISNDIIRDYYKERLI